MQARITFLPAIKSQRQDMSIINTTVLTACSIREFQQLHRFLLTMNTKAQRETQAMPQNTKPLSLQAKSWMM